MDTLLILLSLGPGHQHPKGQDITIHPLIEDLRPRRSTSIQEPPLLATSVCLVSPYAMSCDHSRPTCAMRHIPEPTRPHTPVKPRGSALIPLVTPRPIPKPVALTLGGSLGSYIVPTDQHMSYVRTLCSLMRTRENFPVGHTSQIAPSQARLTCRFFRDRLSKKDASCWYGYSINSIKSWARTSLSQRPVYHKLNNLNRTCEVTVFNC
jgi:hypothetical protein